MDNKRLLLDYMPFSMTPEQINESIEENQGRLIVKGVMQRADARNQNNRIYPMKVLAREATKYTDTFINQKRALGELDHPESSTVNLRNVSHNIVEMNWKGNELHGVVEILGTPSGNILKELLKSGVTLGISSRGVGSVKELASENGGSPSFEIQEDFELICFDFVSNPSTHGAFLGEGIVLDESGKANKKINNLITSILCDLNTQG